MKNTNLIGLDKEKTKELAKKLNELLSSFQIYYQNLRGFHWNIQGRDFFELHLKFEELYNTALLNLDEIAERILTLGEEPLHSFSDYLDTSKIKEVKNCYSGEDAIAHILNMLKSLLEIERESLKLASISYDEGSAALMSNYIQDQEKLMWMLNAWQK